MKILSKYKDYYDYLIGIYGEDPLIVLDRRNHKQHIDLRTDVQKLEGKGFDKKISFRNIK